MNINKSEWIILEHLWDDSCTMMQLYHILYEETGWSKSTVVTLLGRMTDKKIIAYKEEGKARVYYAIVKREEATISETRSFVDKVFRGSVNMLMSTLIKSNELSNDEIQELRELLTKAGDDSD